MDSKRLRTKQQQQRARKRRVRMSVTGTALRPRISVFRSLRALSLQAIDDTRGYTLAKSTLRDVGKNPKNNVLSAEKVGALLGAQLIKLGITTGVYDRGGYRYHGKVKAAADGVRSAGVAL